MAPSARLLTTLVIAALLAIGAVAPAAQAQIYVDATATGAGNGSSWTDAYPTLQAALAEAGAGDSIWVAEGTYYPDEGPGLDADTRSTSFVLKDGVQIYGGFAGGETTLDARDVDANRTILSGDVDGDSTLTGNSYHVVFSPPGVGSTTRLDGVTITGGNANRTDVDVDEDGTTDALFGGGIYIGALGAQSSPTLVNLTITNNEADQNGGGLFLATDGGASAHPEIANVTFAGNRAGIDGGAVGISAQGTGTVDPLIANAIFRSNEAGSEGGAISVIASTNGDTTPSLVHATLVNNQAGVDAGGALVETADAGDALTIRNSLLWGNTANGTLDQAASGSVRFSYSLVQGSGGSTNWGITPTDDGGNLDTDPLLLDAQSGDLRINWASPAIDAGSSLLPPDSADVDGDGNTTEVLPVDRSGQPRSLASRPDIGAYEGGAAPTAAPLRVDRSAGADAGSHGGSWSAPYRTLQAALTAAKHRNRAADGVPFDDIWVAQGTYYPDEGPDVDNDVRTQSFTLLDSVGVYGGFQNGDPFSARDPDPATNGTVLSGDIDQSGDPAGNAYHVVDSRRSNSLATALDGFTITGGNASASGNNSGGGIHLAAPGDAISIQPTLRNLRLQDNYANTGAGLYGFAGGPSSVVHPLLVNVDFVRNEATSNGGGAVFDANGASVAPVMLNVRFRQNQGAQAGAFGLISKNGGTVRPILANAVVNANVSAPDSATAVVRTSANGTVEPTFVNTTWAQNTTSGGTTDSLSALMTVRGSQAATENVQVANSVLWGNGARATVNERTGPVSLNASVVEGGWSGTGTGIVDANPQFANPAGPDNTPGTADDSLQVLGPSPALNQGDATVLPSDAGDLNQNGDDDETLPEGLGGRARVQAGQVDAGAYEGAVSPSVVAAPASDVSDTRAVLSGVVVPYASSAPVTFEYGPTGGAQQTVQATTIAGTDSVAVALPVDGLSPSTEYTYRVRASNGTRTTQAQGAFTTLSASPIDAQVSAARVDSSVTVDVAVAADAAPSTRRTLHVRKGGARLYNTLDLQTVETTEDSVQLRARVPDSLATARGLDYYVVLSDGETTLTIPSGGETAAARQPRHLSLAFDTLTAPTAFAPRRYQMVTVPAAPDGGIKAALQSAYGGTYDPGTWRLERWDPTREAYTPYSSLDRLRPGDAFWLVTNEGTPPTLDAGRTVPADTARTIPLDVGWNQIGSPFAFPVAWSTVTGASDLGDSVGAPVAYGDSTFQRGRALLQPWTGYFVFSTTADTLTVPPVAASTAAPGEALPGARASWPRDADAAKKSTRDRYTVRVEAAGADETAHAHLGLWADAQTDWDRFDRPQLPPLHSSLRLAAVESVNGRAVALSHSAKPADARNDTRGQHWTLRLHNRADHDRSVRLRLRATGSLPDGHQRYVLDLDREQRLAPGAALSLTAGERRRLKVIVGTDRYAKQQRAGLDLDGLETTLRGNYPNPFRTHSTIKYAVGEAQPVTIEVYNVLGQRVRTLVDERKEAGVHTRTWDGTNRYGTRVGSGVYFYRMEAGDVTETKKMVLVR